MCSIMRLRSFASRRFDRTGGARHLLPAAGTIRTFENIRVKSIIGRFLEHGRNLLLRHGTRLAEYKSCCVYLLRRHDAAQPRPPRRSALSLQNPTVHQQVLEQIMVANLKDTEQSWQFVARWVINAYESRERRRAFQFAQLLHDESESVRPWKVSQGIFAAPPHTPQRTSSSS